MCSQQKGSESTKKKSYVWGKSGAAYHKAGAKGYTQQTSVERLEDGSSQVLFIQTGGDKQPERLRNCPKTAVETNDASK